MVCDKYIIVIYEESRAYEKKDRYIQVSWSFILVTIFVDYLIFVCLNGRSAGCHLHFQSSFLLAYFSSILWSDPIDIYLFIVIGMRFSAYDYKILQSNLNLTFVHLRIFCIKY